MASNKMNNIILVDNDSVAAKSSDFIISRNDLKYCPRIYKKYSLEPEYQESVTVLFVFQKDKLIRYLIKELDILLRKGGLFNIILVDNRSHSQYLRSTSQVKYEFSIATNGRYTLESSQSMNGVLSLMYRKQALVLQQGDTINSWSFGIVSNGKKNEWVLALIDSIKRQNIPEYEIIICGPSPYGTGLSSRDQHVTISNNITVTDDIRAPISHKKNRIIELSKYNNLCVLHDRYLLPDNWFKQFREFGNYFDALCLRTISEDGKRFTVDWMKYYYPLTSRFKINGALAYDEWHEEAIIPGGVILVKKNLVESFMLDERLHWDELEDMQFSKIAYLNGLLIRLESNNYFISRQVRHITQTSSWYHLNIRKKFSWFLGVVGNYLRYKKIIKIYYKQSGDAYDEKKY